MTLRGCAALLVLGALAGCGGEQAADGSEPAQAPTSAPAPRAADGFRLVGFGDIAIEVPESWGTNRATCGTPVKDTVEIDVGGVRGCLVPRPKGVESVAVFRTGDTVELKRPGTVEIDGRTALREKPVCTTDVTDGQVCRATVHFPAEAVAFRAASSTSRAKVDEILDRIRVRPGAVGVPGFRDDQSAAQENSGVTYLDELREAGLEAKLVEERRPGLSAGFVLGAQPAPGTMLRPGDTVTVTVVPAARGAADKINVRLAATDADGGEGPRLTDEQIRAGATVRMPVGGELRVYGKNPDVTLGGTLDGDSLAPAKGRNRAAHWRATRPGRTKLTVTADDGGGPDEVGIVTVIVS